MATQASAQRVAGMIEVRVDGEIVQAAGAFTFNQGLPKREMLVGHDGVHGTKEVPQVPFIEGTARFARNLNAKTLASGTNQTVTLKLPNGQVGVLRNADACGEFNGNTEDGTIECRWEGRSFEWVRG